MRKKHLTRDFDYYIDEYMYNCRKLRHHLRSRPPPGLLPGCQEIITEAFTGKTMESPRFSALFQELQPGDTLVVTKLDRFAWTAIEGVSTVRELFERRVRVHILNMGLVENTLTGNLILTVILAFAEYERGMIVERTQTGKAVARQDPNYREGRPKKYLPSQIAHALKLLQDGKTFRQVENMTGISKSTLIRAKRLSADRRRTSAD